VLNKTGGKWLTPYIDEHRPECDGGRAEDSRSSEFEEGRRGWKKCACLIHVSGTLGGKFSRKQTGKSAWDESKGVLEAARSWDNPATSSYRVKSLWWALLPMDPERGTSHKDSQGCVR
jgi:hypothetical protein